MIEDLTLLRESLGLSQSEMAKELGVSQATICRMEKGVTKPSGPVKKLALLLTANVAPAPSAKARRG